jgi:hypothetical protein
MKPVASVGGDYMKHIIHTSDYRDEKHNWVDECNNLVGFDTGQCCCENARWFYQATDVEIQEDAQVSVSEAELDAYSFDTKYEPKRFDNGGVYDVDGYVLFRLTACGEEDLFLVLANEHNGYYSHGWESLLGDKKEEGYI